MPAYLIADIKLKDDAWLPGYAQHVHEIVHKHGGRYLTRTAQVQTLEGEPLDTSLVAIIEFPSTDAVHAFAADPDYAPFAASRQRGSESRLSLVEGADVAGTISYLPQA